MSSSIPKNDKQVVGPSTLCVATGIPKLAQVDNARSKASLHSSVFGTYEEEIVQIVQQLSGALGG